MSKNKHDDILTEHSKNKLLFLEFRKLVKIYEYLYTKVDELKEKTMLKHKIISLKILQNKSKYFLMK